jgi:bifunctional oligoribonuclease and PAP phosphatase NrnA
MSLKKAVECVKRNKSFLITAHTSLEGDALGSELAFYNLLKKLGKQAVIVNEDPVPPPYQFLPGLNKIFGYKVVLCRKLEFDCFAALDCSDLNRTGEVYKLNSEKREVLNVDHHISNSGFGDVNWVEPNFSSCCEMIYALYKKLKVALDKETAICLYSGILTDTGSFHYSNTGVFTHKAVAELLGYNLDVAGIYKNIYENIPFQDMRVLAKILPEIKLAGGGRIAWCSIKRSVLKRKKLFLDLSEQILSFERLIKDVEAAVIFKENLGATDEIRINFRSQGKVDVNKIAQFFGGGGHKTASGATVKGTIDTVRRRVLAKIKENLK